MLIGMCAGRSRGAAVTDVIIFGIGKDWMARAACNAILIQGVGQYLVNLNIWTHNILTLLARSRVSTLHPYIGSRRQSDLARDDADHQTLTAIPNNPWHCV